MVELYCGKVSIEIIMLSLHQSKGNIVIITVYVISVEILSRFSFR